MLPISPNARDRAPVALTIPSTMPASTTFHRNRDPATIGPQMPEVANDLPAGARRLKQKADGLLATVVNGEVVLREQEHTGAYPGQVLRGPLAERIG